MPIATPEIYAQMLDRAKQQGFAYPAINVTSTQTLPLLVYGEFQAGSLETSIAAGAILVLAALGVLVAVRGLGWSRALDIGRFA